MKPAYSRVAWGLALTLIDFRIQNFDILPDLVGYALIMAGLSGVMPKNRYFDVGRITAFILMIYSISYLFGKPMEISLTHPVAPTLGQMLIAGAESVVQLAMLFGICAGIRLNAASGRRIGLAHYAKRIWEAVFGLGAAMLFCMPFTLNTSSNEFLMFSVALGFSSFVASLFVISLVRRAGRQPDPDGGDHDEPAEAASTVA